MLRSGLRPAVVLVAAGLVLAACGHAAAPPENGSAGPAKVEPIAGTQLHRLVLSQGAVAHLGVRTGAVRGLAQPATATTAVRLKESVPFSALLYDSQGRTWVYVNTAPRTYVRHAVTVGGADGNTVLLTAGPAPGTRVVTAGAPELLGTEFGVGGE